MLLDKSVDVHGSGREYSCALRAASHYGFECQESRSQRVSQPKDSAACCKRLHIVALVQMLLEGHSRVNVGAFSLSDKVAGMGIGQSGGQAVGRWNNSGAADAQGPFDLDQCSSLFTERQGFSVGIGQ